VTGPAQFTDAVLRYLLVQYGVNPEQLVGMEDGALIGDVL
jgi:alpha 1,6-mannosyltransferase